MYSSNANLAAIMAAASLAYSTRIYSGVAHSDTYFVPPRRGSITRKGQPTRRRRSK